MPLQALLDDTHPAWLADAAGQGPDPALLAQAKHSALGQRLLVRMLPPRFLDGLLAPRPGGAAYRQVARRWPRSRVRALVRDLGVLAHAPVIRGEVRREPVRWLRRTLGNSYLLALDPVVWDGRVAREVHQRLQADWDALLGDPRALPDAARVGAVLDRQGRAELEGWALRRERALADWVRLMLGDPGDATPHLPEKAVLRIATHHEHRDGDER